MRWNRVSRTLAKQGSFFCFINKSKIFNQKKSKKYYLERISRIKIIKISTNENVNQKIFFVYNLS